MHPQDRRWLFTIVLIACADDPSDPAKPNADGGVPDAGVIDTGVINNPPGDAGADVVTCVDDQPLPLLPTAPATLSGTGLYTDIATKTLNPAVRTFEPIYPLWSDGAGKVRRVYLPKCTQVDTTDMDHWKMPIGARFWKDFTRDGVLVETRFIHRYGPGATDWTYAAYQWRTGSGASDADHVPNGVADASATAHDIPDDGACLACHTRLPERILGFSALQLSHQGAGETMATLSNAGWLSTPHPEGYTIPGDAKAKAALGYLHANCGNCHNPTGVPEVNLRLRVLVGNTTVESTDIVKSAVNVAATRFQCNGCSRIASGDAGASAVIQRMHARGGAAQMPPIGTELPDDAGINVVSDWIHGL